ncbi:TetR/AcrR family transcriptional regulator [Companilactobacillus zhongbaensis]|uniref:TetR/AcrR family transcriptional regulator n=1 Tax=Companilactobacillus zhongbaensis TaxID=2486009 RepID=UPI000F79D259|nr:TetR/AcrR family transcriptional regulator [Companilactobacillus zhongbaensis]
MVNIYSQNQKDAKRQSIMDAAIQLFKNQSFSNITMKKIADTAGISKGTIFHYFQTKEDLFMSVLLENYYQFFSNMMLELNEYHRITKDEYIKIMVNQTSTLITKHDVLVRLNTIRGPILEGKANMDETVKKRNQLYSISKKLGQLLSDKTSGLLTQQQFSHILIIQSGIISGLMNMASLTRFNHTDLGIDYPDFEINLESEAKQQMRFYLTKYLEEIKDNG